MTFEFFAFDTRLPIMAILASNYYTAGKIIRSISSGAQSDDHWMKGNSGMS